MNAEQVIRTYFSGEKSEAALILLAGVICLIAAVWLWVGPSISGRTTR